MFPGLLASHAEDPPARTSLAWMTWGLPFTITTSPSGDSLPVAAPVEGSSHPFDGELGSAWSLTPSGPGARVGGAWRSKTCRHGPGASWFRPDTEITCL